MKPWMLITGGIAAVAIFLGVYLFTTLDGIQRDGVDYETQLTSQYLANQSKLSAYVSGFYEQLQIADRKSDKIDKILLDAVKGRYDNPNSNAKVNGGQVFSAIVEAYPDLKGLDIYDKLIVYVQAERENYHQMQTKLLDMLRGYNKWRKSGIIHSRMVSFMGFPSDNLEARVGRNVTRGLAAVDQMLQIVIDSKTYEAYQNGQLDPLGK